MKRFIAVALVMLMLVGILTSCSAITIRMLDLCVEMSKVKTGTSTGSISLKLNEKNIANLLQDVEDPTGLLEQLPFKEATISYEAKYDQNKENFGLSLALKCSIDGNSMDFGDVFVNDENVYISSKTLFSILDFAGVIYPDESETLEVSKAIFKEMLGNATHIELLPSEEYNFSDIPDTDDLTDIFAGFAKDIFWNFNFYSVKLSAENTYTLSMNVNEIQSMLINAAEYLIVNQQRVFDAAERFVTKMYDAGLNEMLGLEGELDEALATIKENRSASISYSSEYKKSLKELKETIANFEGLKDYDKSSFTYSIGTYKNSYLQKLDAVVKNGNNTLFEFTAKSSVVVEDVKFDDIKALSYEDFVGLMVSVEE